MVTEVGAASDLVPGDDFISAEDAASDLIPGEDYISAEDRGVMVAGQSRKEACSRMKMFTHPKVTLRLGCWNVRTMFATGKTAQVCREMRRYRLEVLGISECRWKECGKVKTREGEEILYSGSMEKHEHGVAIILSKNAAQSLMSWKPVNERIVTARLYSKFIKATIVQAYAPQNGSSVEAKDEFYQQLQKVYSEIPNHDMVISMGDFNAKIGSQYVGEEGIVGRHVLKGDRTDNGSRFVSMCEVSNMPIVSTMFPHKDIHKVTWNSPDGVTQNQIDHITINSKFRRSVMDVRAYRAADAESDHNLVVGTVKLKLARVGKKQEKRRRYNYQKLKQKEVRQKFTIELKNRFSCLQVDEAEVVGSEGNTVSTRLEKHWNTFKDAYNDTAKKVLGSQRGSHKPWISEDSWSKIDERKELKKKMLDTKSERLKQRINTDYKEKAREVKRNLQQDRRRWADNLATDAENAFQCGNMKGVYDSTKMLTNSQPRKMDIIKDKGGKLLTSERDTMERWKEHFTEVLNRPEPEIPADVVTDGVQELEVNTGYITKEEIKWTLKSLKNNKATGIDNIAAEVLKADIDTTASEMEKLFKEVWDTEEVPDEWKQGLIVKLPKKGDLTVCGNWRGLTLMSVPAKCLGKSMIHRIRDDVDKQLRREQAGFRPKHGTEEQIFILRNIIEQSLEWNTVLYLVFVDYEKAFDSIDRDTLWKIMKSYGIPDKFIAIVRAFYRNNRAAVLHGDSQSEMFEIKSGVKQGCVMSGFLFLLVIDWIMRRTVEGERTGIRWRMMDTLEDLDYADDIVLITESWRHAQQKLERLNSNGLRTGLKINKKKTESLRINAANNSAFKVGDEDIKDVESFTYLGATVTTTGGAAEDINKRIGKARQAYYRLRKIWSSSILRRKTKMRIFQANVVSVLVYGCTTWKMTVADEHKLDVFVHSCLRRILKIYWPTRMSNEEVRRIAGVQQVSTQIRTRRWKYIGHILRMDSDDNQRVALRWTPAAGRRRRGRPKETWRRTVERERHTLGFSSWEAAAAVANDRDRWRKLTKCPTLHSRRNRN